jgi:hypothetical protein
MEPTPYPFTSHEIEVPEGIRQSRLAFIRDFPALMANRKTRGKYVCYHRDSCVAINSNYRAIIQEVTEKNIPEDASLILHVIPDEDRKQQVLADEGDIELL